MTEYLFILGRTFNLCQSELEAVLKAKKINYQVLFSSSEVFHLETEADLDVDSLIKTLGGTIKIARVEKKLAASQNEQLINETVTILLQSNIVNQKKLTFGFSGYGAFSLRDLNHYSVMIKEELGKKGIATRFVLPKEGAALSSVVVVKQHVTEIILSREEKKLVLAKTVAVSDFEDWGRRDFGRPCSDPHSGMLPPKVARMMVNLGSWNLETGSLTLLDPFCGVGTILAEAMTMGYKVIGSDQSAAAVEKSEKNLQWLVSSFKFQVSSFKVFQSDATHVSEKIPAGSIDAIVTEPYLGPVVPITNLRNIILGLDKLYLGCLREWRKILKPGGMMVMAFPSFKIDKQEFFVKKALDSCEDLGYTLEIGPLTYSRPQAVVRRNIYLLKYGTH